MSSSVASSITSNRAIVKKSTGNAVVQEVPIPKLRDGYILVKTMAVALNPADWTDIDFPDAYEGSIVGLDYSGIVLEVGPGVTKKFEKGDRICGFAHGCNALQHEDGAFAQYIVVKGDVQIHIPEQMSFEEACTLGVGVATVGQAFYKFLDLPFPSGVVGSAATHPQEGTGSWILIYGGSSATGSLAIQFAKLSGFKVATTCSPRNFELVKKFGADVILDYRDPSVSSKIRTATSNTLVHVFDTIATDETASICTNAVATATTSSPTTAIYVCTLDPTLPDPSTLTTKTVPIKKHYMLAYSAFGEDWWFEGEDFAASEEDFNLQFKIAGLAERLLQQGKLVSHPARIGEGELDGVFMGLDEMRQGKVSGVKLVYRIGAE